MTPIERMELRVSPERAGPYVRRYFSEVRSKDVFYLRSVPDSGQSYGFALVGGRMISAIADSYKRSARFDCIPWC